MKYSPERREAILAKLEAPYNRTVNDLASEEGISTVAARQYKRRLESCLARTEEDYLSRITARKPTVIVSRKLAIFETFLYVPTTCPTRDKTIKTSHNKTLVTQSNVNNMTRCSLMFLRISF